MWVQPIGLPKQPSLKNVYDVNGVLVCTEAFNKRMGNKSNCILPNKNTSKRNYRIISIYSKGPGSKFQVTTSDNEPITLEIMGDLDVSDQGIFCHLEKGSNLCGSGKPQNLTLLFKQSINPIKTKSVCDISTKSKGGLALKNNQEIKINEVFDNSSLPGSSIFIDSSASSSFDFSGFIFGPKTTFLSTISKSPWIQKIEPDDLNKNIRGPMIIAHRGTYGFLLNTNSPGRWEDGMPNLILDENNKLIPYLNYSESGDSLEIIGIGYDNPFPPYSGEAKTGKFLIYNVNQDNYFLRGFNIKDKLNPNTYKSNLAFLPWAAAIMTNEMQSLGGASTINTGPSKIELDKYNIKLISRGGTTSMNFKGITWVKNLCFDNFSNQSWEFNNQFIEGIISRYGKEFNYGVKFYRGRSITLWDTLRDFES